MSRARVKLDVATNLVLSLFAAVASLLVVQGATRALPATMLGAFLFTRRIADAASSLFQLGTAFVIRREVARRPDAADRLVFGLAGTLLLVGVALAVWCGTVLFGARVGRWLFPGLADAEALTRWLSVIVVGLTLHYFASSLLFAQRRIVAANVLQLANGGGWLLAALWVLGSGADALRLLKLQGIASTALAALVILIVLAQFARGSVAVRWRDMPDAFREYASYGLPRAISPFGEMMIFLVGPWLLRGNMSEAGFLLIAFSLVRMIQALIQPASNVIGVVSAGLSGCGDDATLQRGMRLLTGLLGATGLAAAVLVIPWLEPLLRVWLRDPMVVAGVLPYARVLVLTIPAFVLFQGLKEPIEMLWHAPRNLGSIALAIAVLTGTYLAAAPIIGSIRAMMLAQFASFTVAGVASVYWIRDWVSETEYFGVRRFILVLALAGAANAAYARYVATPEGLNALLLPLAAMAVAGLIVLALNLAPRPSAFAKELTAFVRR